MFGAGRGHSVRAIGGAVFRRERSCSVAGRSVDPNPHPASTSTPPRHQNGQVDASPACQRPSYTCRLLTAASLPSHSRVWTHLQIHKYTQEARQTLDRSPPICLHQSPSPHYSSWLAPSLRRTPSRKRPVRASSLSRRRFLVRLPAMKSAYRSRVPHVRFHS